MKWPRALAHILVPTAVAALVLVVSFSVTFSLVFRDRLFPAPASVIVYGSANCSFTTALRQELEQRSVPYIFVDVDGPYNFYEMQYRLGVYSGQFDAPTIRLPVIFQAGRARERPSAHEVVELYSSEVSSAN